MVVVPVYTRSSDRGPICLVIVLQKENLDRMKQADPADLQVRKYMPESIKAPLRDLDIVIAYEDDLDTIKNLIAGGDIKGFVNWIERGRRILSGDCKPPERL